MRFNSSIASRTATSEPLITSDIRYARWDKLPQFLQIMLEGSAAGALIELNYDPSLGVQAWLDRWISTIVKESGSTADVPVGIHWLRPDIVDKFTRDLYEIKKATIGATQAQVEAEFYVGLLVKYGAPAHLGSSGDPRTRGVGALPNGTLIGWSSPTPGVILWYPLPGLIPVLVPKRVPDPKLVSIPIYDQLEEIERSLNPRPVWEPVLVPAAKKAGTTAVTVGVGIVVWEVGKRVVAILLAPETGGGSILVEEAIP